MQEKEKKKESKTSREMNQGEFIAKLREFDSHPRRRGRNEITQLFNRLSLEFVKNVCMEKEEYAKLVIQCVEETNPLWMWQKVGEEAATQWPKLRELACKKLHRLSLETYQTWLKDGKSRPEVSMILLSSCALKPKISVDTWMAAFNRLLPHAQETVINEFLGERVTPGKSKQFMTKIYQSDLLSGNNALMKVGYLDPKYAFKVNMMCIEDLKSCALKPKISVDTWMTVLNWLHPDTQKMVINEFLGEGAKPEKSKQFITKIYQSDLLGGNNALKTICDLDPKYAVKVNMMRTENLKIGNLKTPGDIKRLTDTVLPFEYPNDSSSSSSSSEAKGVWNEQQDFVPPSSGCSETLPPLTMN